MAISVVIGIQNVRFSISIISNAHAILELQFHFALNLERFEILCITFFYPIWSFACIDSGSNRGTACG